MSDNSYIYHFIFIRLPGYIMNHELNDPLSVELLLQLVRAMRRYRRGQHPRKPEFLFGLSLCYGFPFVFQQFKYTKFTFSSIQIILLFSLGIALLNNKLLF